jgi:glycosyltransferase involved in cell wall biosynthesis
MSIHKGSYELLKEVIREFDPDIIAVHAPSPNLLMHLQSFQKPVVVWIHGAEVLLRAFHHYISPYEIKNSISKLYSLVYDAYRNLTLRQVIQKVNAIVYVSKWMKRVSEKYLLIKHPHSFVIPNPVDTDLFKPFTTSITKREIAGISVRALEWKYGVDIAVKAFANSGVKLTIIGRGSLEKYLRNLAKLCNANVEFITEGVEHQKLPTIYNNYMFFVAPSRTEAQGVAMCEAMACGLPVVATNVGGIPEFVIDEYNGLLVPPNDPLSLRLAVMRILKNDTLYTVLSENARRFVVNNLSHKIIFQKELKVFENVIEESQKEKNRFVK